MSLKKLATDYKDALFEGLRKYKQIENDDGTTSFADVTTYSQKEGSYYTAKTVNDNHEIINNAIGCLEQLCQDEDELKKTVENQGKKQGSLESLNTENKETLVGAINEVKENLITSIEGVNESVGELPKLSTVEKSSVVAAINEVVKSLGETVSFASDYIIPEQEFEFVNKKCEIEDSRVLSTSLVDVYFTADTIDVAEDADISVESEDGKIVLTATIDPISTIKGVMKVRVK